MLKKSILTTLFVASIIFSNAQLVTPFTIRTQVTQKGGIRFVSNSSVSCIDGACAAAREAMPPLGPGLNNGFVMGYIDADSDLTTFMSSSDSIELPSCSEVTWAGLYWGASSASAMTNYANRFDIKLKVNSGTYQSLTALPENRQDWAGNYIAFADVTAIVKPTGGQARFTIADMVTNVGTANRYGGWTIVIIYKNDLQPMRNLTVFNGLVNVTTGILSTADVPISGFLTPLNGPVTFELGVIAYDGDRTSTGDDFQFNGAGSFLTVEDAIHPASDMFNSTLSYNGTLTPFRLPSYNNSLGYDANIFLPDNTLKTYIGNSATSATIRLTTGSEGILTSVLTSAIDIYEPDMRSAVTVQDLNGGQLEPGDTLEYTIICKNIGSDPAINTFVTDTMQGNANFVIGSTRITYGPNSGNKTDVGADDQAEYSAATKTLKVRIGTGANSSTGGTMNNSPNGIDSTVIKFRVTATEDCIFLQCDNVIDNRAFIYGTGNISGNTFNNGSNPGIFDVNGCPIPGTTSSAINATLCSPPAIASQGPVCIGGSINLFASTSSNVTYAWTGPNTFTSTLPNPVITNITSQMAGTYTVVISVVGTACSYTLSTLRTIGSATQTGGLAGTMGTSPAIQSHDIAIGSGYFMDNNCNLIGRVQPSGSQAVSGEITSKVWIESLVPMSSGSPFVARHYDIAPVTNASTATGTLTLFFLQPEFDAFNTNAGSVMKLPTGPSDAAGIANLRIGYYGGNSADNSGLPSSYSSLNNAVIDPADEGVLWNVTNERWEVTFMASGFGGFIVQTRAFTLPVSWLSFTAKQSGKTVSLKWQTATEVNSSHFVVEHSTNGSNFATIGSAKAFGNSSGLTDYNFIHYNAPNGKNFYRLQQVDIDGRVKYSRIVSTDAPSSNNDVLVLINPVINGRLIVLFGKPTTAFIYNTHGQVIKEQRVDTGRQTINVSDIPPGTYILKAGNENRRFIIN